MLQLLRPSVALCRAGEVFVLDDGGEVDLDLGNYERFLDITLHRDNNIHHWQDLPARHTERRGMETSWARPCKVSDSQRHALTMFNGPFLSCNLLSLHACVDLPYKWLTIDLSLRNDLAVGGDNC